MPSFAFNSKFSQGARGASLQAQSATVKPKLDANTSKKYWSEIISQTPSTQLKDIVNKVFPDNHEKYRKLNTSETRDKLIIDILEKSRNGESANDIEKKISKAKLVLKHVDDMEKDSMLEIVGIINKDAPELLKHNSPDVICDWINCSFMPLSLRDKIHVLGERDKILARTNARKVSKDAGKKEKTPTADDGDGDFLATSSDHDNDGNDALILEVSDDLTNDDMKKIAFMIRPELQMKLKSSKKIHIVKKCNAAFQTLSSGDKLAVKRYKEELLIEKKDEREERQAAGKSIDPSRVSVGRASNKAVPKFIAPKPKQTALKMAAPEKAVPSAKQDIATLSRLLSELKISIVNVSQHISVLEHRREQK